MFDIHILILNKFYMVYDNYIILIKPINYKNINVSKGEYKYVKICQNGQKWPKWPKIIKKVTYDDMVYFWTNLPSQQ